MSYSKIVLILVGWWILLVTIHTYIIYDFGFDWQIALIDSVISNCLIIYGGLRIVKFMPNFSLTIKYFTSITVSSILLSVAFVLFVRKFLPYFIEVDYSYIEFLNNSYKVRIAVTWLIIVSFISENILLAYVQDEKENEKRKSDAENLAKEAELSNLRKQLQPHFLFNSLNSISALVNSKPTEARKMIQQLSDFLRGTLKKDEQQLVSFIEELKQLELYLEIEKVRFGHRLNTKIEYTDSCKNFQIPPLLLQPIVENAIKFGLYDTTEEISINIKAYTDSNYLIISVENPFDTHSSVSNKGTGFGLVSIQRRLYLLYARNDLLLAEQKGSIFITTVKIPKSL